MLTHINHYTLARSKQISDKSDGFRAEGTQKGPWDNGKTHHLKTKGEVTGETVRANRLSVLHASTHSCLEGECMF